MTTMRRRKARPGRLLPFLLLLLALAGCKETQKEQDGKEEAAQEETAPEAEEESGSAQDPELYILLYSNPDTKRLFLQSASTGRQEEFSYNGGTYIYDRFGESTTISRIPVGTLVYLAYTDKMLLTSLKEATDTFLYEDITNYSQNPEKSMFTILGNNYYYDKDLKVFSQEDLIALNEVGSQDALTIRGMGKRIVSIVVSRGHGAIALKNTELFEGGMVVVGNVEAQVITANMKLEVPEGTYSLSAANDGYGGSCEVTVKRNEEVEVDLEPLKGEGPKYCQLKIDVEPDDTIITLDGTEIDCFAVQQLKYGVYAIKAKAPGYQSWSGRLVVNSEEAVMDVSLIPLGDVKEEEAEEKDEEEETPEEGNASGETVTTGG